MSFLEFYALVGAPVLLLVFAIAILWVTRLQDAPRNRPREHHGAAE